MAIETKGRLVVVLLLLALVQVVVRFAVLPELDRRASGRVQRTAEAAIVRRMYTVLSSFGVRLEWVKDRDGVWLVRLPADLPASRLFAEMAIAVQREGAQVVQSKESDRTGRIEFTVRRRDKTLRKVVLLPDRDRQRPGGRIAVIIDDWGYGDLDLLDDFLALPVPLSFAVIPGLPRSREAAERIRRSGHALLVHLPMEPLEGKVESDGFTISSRLSENEMRSRIRRSLLEVPGAMGINNHMGSKATVDERLLGIVMDELHRSGLFFVDSRTNPATRAFEWAGRKGVPTALNDLFLDAREQEEWIEAKLARLADVASRQGQAVGIGHPKRVTLRVLRRTPPRLEQRGYRFVPITEVVR